MEKMRFRMVVLRYRQRVGVHSHGRIHSIVPTYTYIHRLKVQRDDKVVSKQAERGGGVREERETRSAS